MSWLETLTWDTEGMQRSLCHKPYNMCVYGLPLTPAIKVWHFELPWDPKDTEGIWRYLFHCKLLQYECLWTPLTSASAIKIRHFWQTWDPLDIEGMWRSLFHFCHKLVKYGWRWWTLLDPSNYKAARSSTEMPVGASFKHKEYENGQLTRHKVCKPTAFWCYLCFSLR